MIELHAIGHARTKEIGSIHRVIQAFVGHRFQNFGRSQHAHVTGGIHISNGNIRTTKEVDKIRSRLGILGIFRNHPSVEPNVGTFLRNAITQIDTQGFCFVVSPFGIAAPREIHVTFFLRHLFFTEIGLPTGHARRNHLQEIFHQEHVFFVVVVHDGIFVEQTGLNFIVFQIKQKRGIDIATSIFHKNFVVEFRIHQNIPRRSFLVGNIFGVVENSRCSPHIRHGIIERTFIAAIHFLKAFYDKWRKVLVDVIGCRAEIALDGKQEILRHHSFDDIFRRTNHVVIFLAFFDTRKHGFVDVESLIHNRDFFAGLFLIPHFKIVQNRFVDIVGPVVYFQNTATIGAGSREQHQACQNKRIDTFFHFFLFFACLLERIFPIIKRIRIVRKTIDIKGRSSGVRPPLRASL